MRRRGPMGDERGLTLLELLVTLVVLAMIATVVVEGVRLSTRTWDAAERVAEAEQHARMLHDTLARTLASVLAIKARTDGRVVVAFRGAEDRLLLHAAPDREQPLPWGAMVRSLAYFVQPGVGLVVQESYPLVEGQVSLEARGKVNIIEPRAQRIRFRYLVPPPPGDAVPPRWAEVWEPVEVAPGLPLAVEVSLLVAEARTEREISFVVPIHLGRRL